MRITTTSKIAVLICLLALVVLLQYQFDVTRPAFTSAGMQTFSPFMIRAVDMGFHSTVASFFWITTMPEVLDLFRGRTEYFSDLAFVNGIDPKLGYPYAFSVLTLPAIPSQNYPDAVKDSFAIGVQGIQNADPDWRISYYMAINYYLQEKDLKDAVTYFNIAAQTPGIPDYAKRFSINFGINQKERDRVRALWQTVYQSSNDPATKDRAQAYIDRLDIFDYLEAAGKVYKQKYGAYPASPQDLVAKNIIPEVPLDPFGYTFTFNLDGTADIAR